MSTVSSKFWRATVKGGLVAGLLDAVDAIIAFKLVLGLAPIPIYQFVASGIVGSKAFTGGLATAALGLAIHFLIAFTAAAVYNVAALRMTALKARYASCGLAFGFFVYAFMNYLVIPLSAIPPSSFSLPLFINGVAGHALLVGLPIAFFASRNG